jgi:hypothetical protein
MEEYAKEAEKRRGKR